MVVVEVVVVAVVLDSVRSVSVSVGFGRSSQINMLLEGERERDREGGEGVKTHPHANPALLLLAEHRVRQAPALHVLPHQSAGVALDGPEHHASRHVPGV